MERPKIGVALASGCARGLANIGVLKALRDNNIPIDYIAGTSAGAVVGALYCAGHELKDIEGAAVALTNRKLLDWAIPVPRLGFVKGDKISQMLRYFLSDLIFSDLKLPLQVVATQLNTGQTVCFYQGKVVDAVRASVAIPGIIVPHQIGQHIYVDGSVTQPIPVSVVRQMGADIVIAVDLHHTGVEHCQLNGPSHVIMHSLHLMEKRTIHEAIKAADVVISPQIAGYHWRDFQHGGAMIEQGKVATEQMLADIERLVSAWGNRSRSFDSRNLLAEGSNVRQTP